MIDSDFGIPGRDPVPPHTPEHRRRILKEKGFEIGVVILLIIGGMSFLSWRSRHAELHANPAVSLAASAEVIEHAGLDLMGQGKAMGRRIVTLTQDLDVFLCGVELVGIEEDTPLETAIIWLAPAEGKWSPGESSLQAAVNRVAVLAQTLVPTSGEAFEKAVNTLTTIDNEGRVHDKGVAGTSDGWKLTYIAFRSFDDTATSPEPVLYLVLQRLSAASDTTLAEFNRTLYDAVDRGVAIKPALEAKTVH
ncbi:MAG: hypothetical protein AMXMBFR84_35510 [Candidatus Hydrogenedentota bacterium]